MCVSLNYDCELSKLLVHYCVWDCVCVYPTDYLTCLTDLSKVTCTTLNFWLLLQTCSFLNIAQFNKWKSFSPAAQEENSRGFPESRSSTRKITFGSIFIIKNLIISRGLHHNHVAQGITIFCLDYFSFLRGTLSRLPLKWIIHEAGCRELDDNPPKVMFMSSLAELVNGSHLE